MNDGNGFEHASLDVGDDLGGPIDGCDRSARRIGATTLCSAIDARNVEVRRVARSSGPVSAIAPTTCGRNRGCRRKRSADTTCNLAHVATVACVS